MSLNQIVESAKKRGWEVTMKGSGMDVVYTVKNSMTGEKTDFNEYESLVRWDNNEQRKAERNSEEKFFPLFEEFNKKWKDKGLFIKVVKGEVPRMYFKTSKNSTYHLGYFEGECDKFSYSADGKPMPAIKTGKVSEIESVVKRWVRSLGTFIKNHPCTFPGGSHEQTTMEYQCLVYKELSEKIGQSWDKGIIEGCRDALFEAKDKLVLSLMFDKGKYVDVVEFCGLGKAKEGSEDVKGADIDKEMIKPAEVNIKESSESAKTLKDFVKRVAAEIDNDHDITTFFIDTDMEYKKFKISVPGICLVVRDLRATKASLKREPIVIKFDKSKTLKRYSDWKKGKIEGVGDAWYSIYVSAKDAREQSSEAMNEDIEEGVYLGYLDEDGEVILAPRVNDVVEYSGKHYVISAVDGARVTLLNEEEEIEMDERDIQYDSLVLDEESGEDLGEGLVLLGRVGGRLVVCDDSENVYLMD